MAHSGTGNKKEVLCKLIGNFTLKEKKIENNHLLTSYCDQDNENATFKVYSVAD